MAAIDALTGKILWLRNSSLGAAGTLSAWADSSPVSRSLALVGSAPAIQASQTPNSKKAVAFSDVTANGIDLNRTDATVFTASSTYDTPYLPKYAGDTDNASYWHSATTSMPQWWQAQVATAAVATGYTVRPVNGSPSGPGTFKLQGSNDGSSWTDLDSRSGITWSAGTAQTFTFSNSTAYLYYRLYVTAAPDGFLRLGTVSIAGVPFVIPGVAARDGELWVVLKSDFAASSNNGGAFQAGNSGQSTHYAFSGAVYDDTGVSTRYSYTPTLSIDSWRIYRVQVSGTTWKAWIDGTLQSTQTSVTRAWSDTIRLGQSFTAVKWGGKIAEVLVFDRALDTTDAGIVSSYLTAELFTAGTPTATGSGSFQWAGSGAGKLTPKGAGTGAFTWSGVGAGKRVNAGTGVGSFAWAGTGVGSAPAVGAASGVGVGSFGWVGTGVGSALRKGTGTGAFSWAGSGVGANSSIPAGSGVGSYAWSGLAFGDSGAVRATVSLTHTPVGILSVIPLVPVSPLATAVPVTRLSILAPDLSAEYPEHPAQGTEGAPAIVEGAIGYPQLFIGGVNVTNLRGVPVTIRRWESEAPFGDTVAAFEFPQLNPWDKPGTGDLAFLQRDARVAIAMREETVGDGFAVVRTRRLWSGFLDARGNGLGEGEDYSWEAKGTFWQAQSQIREPHAIIDPVDIGVWIARVLNAVEGRRWATMPLTPIGITTMTRGSRDQYVMDYVQDLLSEAITDDFRQWSLVEVMPGVPRLVLKPAPSTVHATVAYGTPGVDIDLRVDESTRVDRIFMRGIGKNNGGWANVFYPWLDDFLNAPPYPMATLTDYFVLGTADADTATGSGVTDLQRRIDDLSGFANPPVSGAMSSAWVAVIDDLQRRLHITVDGVAGPQVWARLFDGQPNPESIKPRRLPMASKIEAEKYLYAANGKRLPGSNPQWDGRVARDIAIDAGVGRNRADGFKLARKLLGIYGEPAANGQIVWTTDPRETDRTRLSHLSNVKVTGFEGETRVVQVSSKSVELEAGDDGPVYVVTTRVDERARDAMVVEDLLNQRRDAQPDPSRRPGTANRASRQVSDQRIPWDSDSRCGKVRRTAVNGASGLWTGITLPFAETGKIAGIRLHSTRPFMWGLFESLRITENKMASRGDPWASDDFWRDNKDYFDGYRIVESFGQRNQACGYSPKVETAIPGGTAAGPFTGDFILDTPIDYSTETPPAVKLMVHMRGGSGWVWGEFIPAYET